jgi:peroxidase
MDPVTMSSTIILFREHNNWAQKFASEDPTLTDEELFKKAKTVITAMFQRIVYYEYLPALMGVPLEPYSAYDPSLNPAADPHFLNCAMVYGHSELGEVVARVDDRMASIPNGGLLIEDVIAQPFKYMDAGLEPVLRGLASTVQGKVDTYIIDFFRGGMHQGPNRAPWRDLRDDAGSNVGTGHGTIDTKSRHIMRGRDVRLRGINTVRANLPVCPCRR